MLPAKQKVDVKIVDKIRDLLLTWQMELFFQQWTDIQLLKCLLQEHQELVQTKSIFIKLINVFTVRFNNLLARVTNFSIVTRCKCFYKLLCLKLQKSSFKHTQLTWLTRRPMYLLVRRLKAHLNSTLCLMKGLMKVKLSQHFQYCNCLQWVSGSHLKNRWVMSLWLSPWTIVKAQVHNSLYR